MALIVSAAMAKVSKKTVDRRRIEVAIGSSVKVVGSLVLQSKLIAKAAQMVIDSLKSGGKILTCGHGGSAAEAMHMSEEFIGRFRKNRVSLPAIALSADPTALTCIGNDFGFDSIFSRQIEGLARPGDVLVVISSSGRAPSLKLALKAAKAKKARTICLLGKGGGPIKGMADCEIIVAGSQTERIQEAQLVIVHLILDAVEEAFS